MTKGYVQEQVVTTLAMVADASEATFAKVGVAWPGQCLDWVLTLVIALLVDHAVTPQRPQEREWGRAQEIEVEGYGVCRAYRYVRSCYRCHMGFILTSCALI